MLQLYRYKARSRSGELLTGLVRGADEVAVEAHLASLRLLPVKISLNPEFSLGKLLRLQRRKAGLEDLILITRQFSTLYRAGIPILKMLEIVSERYAGTPLEETLLSVRDDLEKGELFSDCMDKHPHVFSPTYVASIRAAEASGKLDIVLDRLASTFERELVTGQEIRKALRYPLMVIAAIVIALLVLTTLVVPKFAEFYKGYDAELPMPTQIIIAFSEIITGSWYVAFPLLIVIGIAVVRIIKHPKMRRTVDSVLLKLPVLGSLLTKIALSRFSHLLAVLIASGTPLIKSYEIVREAVGNVVIGEEIAILSDCQREGGNLIEIRHRLQHFPNLAVSLIHIGLESGKLEMTLQEISRFFDRDVKYSSERLTSSLEPILILFIGGMILFMALAIFLPMWNLISIFKG
ncbi:MAG: type II secretion system F family protein [candidate division Zixibacteria bacterium]|nr:type II secretion system F family protein [candidate division Zixibacteria bacterium]